MLRCFKDSYREQSFEDASSPGAAAPSDPVNFWKTDLSKLEYGSGSLQASSGLFLISCRGHGGSGGLCFFPSDRDYWNLRWKLVGKPLCVTTFSSASKKDRRGKEVRRRCPSFDANTSFPPSRCCFWAVLSGSKINPSSASHQNQTTTHRRDSCKGNVDFTAIGRETDT